MQAGAMKEMSNSGSAGGKKEFEAVARGRTSAPDPDQILKYSMEC